MAYYIPTSKLQYSKHLQKYIIVDNDGTITYANGDTPVVKARNIIDIPVQEKCSAVRIDANIMRRFFKYVEEHSFIHWDTYSPNFRTSDFAVSGFSKENCAKFRIFHKAETDEYVIQGPFCVTALSFLRECIIYTVDDYNDYLQQEKLNPEY